MRQILDLHIHSRYSRACSRDLTLANIARACEIKGVDIVATGDFTYPEWFQSIKEELVEKDGLLSLKNGEFKTKFILSTEVALIYKDSEKVRRVHLVILAPSVKAVEELNKYLDKHFNIRSDGRPILGMSSPDLVKLCLSIDPKFLIIPAHIWTPWFSVFGSKSGFNSLKECFHEQTKHIYAYETGLSSDPEMNWRWSELDNLTLLSSSDAHSLPNIAREANIFDLPEISYDAIYNAIKNKKGILKTIEFYPEEGMYHIDGHRACGASFLPSETKKLKGICPKCKKLLTIGVLNRVEEMADRPLSARPKGAADFVKLVELDKIIAEALDIKSRHSKRVRAVYNELVKNIGPELYILLDASKEELKKAPSSVVEGIRRVRAGKLFIKPGFDGQYGEVRIFSPEEKKENRQQKLL